MDWGELALRKIRKIKYSRLFIIIIFAYILLQITINIIGNNIETLVIESETIELKVRAKGLVIRDEYLIKSNQSENIKNMVKDGEKLKKGDALAAIYNNSKSLEENKNKIIQLNKEIEDLEAEYSNSKSNLSKELIDIKIKTKKEQRAVLNYENNKNVNYLSMPTSGVVSTKYDGYEDIYTVDKLENLTAKDIEDVENNYKKLDTENTFIKESEVIARVIQSDYSYIAILTENDIFEDNQKVEIVFDSDNVQGNVEEIYRNGDNNVVIFKISNQNVEIYDTRVKEFDIIYKQIDGLKVPKQSIEEVNNQKGVYVLNQETRKVDFVELKTIQYEDDEVIFIDYYKNQKEGIKTIDIHDEIILKPNSINKNIKISRW